MRNHLIRVLKGLVYSFAIFLIHTPKAATAQNVRVISDFEGTTFNAGWEYFHACCSYSMALNTSIKRTGTKSVRMELRDTDPLVASGTRAELVFNYQQKDPQWKWYQFSVQFPAGAPQDNVYEIISQWHYEPTGGGSTFSPPMALTIRNGNFYLDLRYDSTDINIYGSRNVKQQYIDLGPWVAGTWTDWVVYYSPSWQTDGIVRIWKNGVKVLDRIGRNFYRGALPPYWKIGPYKWSWNSGTTLTKTRVIHYDNVKVGNNNATLNDFGIASGGTNQAPTANAGADKTVVLPTNSTSLSGTGSSDPDGTIVSHNWRQLAGPNTATISAASSSSTNIGNLVQGTYSFRLTVTDNAGATSTDDVNVLVSSSSTTNQVPVVNAGGNRSITLPTNSVALNGGSSYDPDGTIASWRWAQVSGPSTATLTNSTTSTLTASNLVAGTYSFRLTVTDNAGATASATANVSVSTATTSNIAPTANAGSTRTIHLPTNSITLSGSASSDPDGTIASYRWTQVSGPSTATLTNSTSVNMSASSLVAGTYSFRLTVTDNNGATGTTTVSVIVNRPPIANPGSNVTINLPTTWAPLNGSGSSDPDGTIAYYRWSQVSGPNTAIFSSTTSASISVRSLIAGTYAFRLTVTDNRGAVASNLVYVYVR
ncbi:heparin lyase I family protein [Flavihumibacter rivuli]|uniref:polysaccharide lyase n=1 Tax=Flavihumibacter rivuli TaxID=2838156 RepID=UPI001BDE3156|nr:polysaccharide lyase [Flavihumibacter rivuli]ULQ57955.1 heparin lyase I family protein [Flavihumibacter rivuli]